MGAGGQAEIWHAQGPWVRHKRTWAQKEEFNMQKRRVINAYWAQHREADAISLAQRREADAISLAQRREGDAIWVCFVRPLAFPELGHTPASSCQYILGRCSFWTARHRCHLRYWNLAIRVFIHAFGGDMLLRLCDVGIVGQHDQGEGIWGCKSVTIGGA